MTPERRAKLRAEWEGWAKSYVGDPYPPPIWEDVKDLLDALDAKDAEIARWTELAKRVDADLDAALETQGRFERNLDEIAKGIGLAKLIVAQKDAEIARLRERLDLIEQDAIERKTRDY